MRMLLIIILFPLLVFAENNLRIVDGDTIHLGKYGKVYDADMQQRRYFVALHQDISSKGTNVQVQKPDATIRQPSADITQGYIDWERNMTHHDKITGKHGTIGDKDNSRCNIILMHHNRNCIWDEHTHSNISSSTCHHLGT